MGEHSHFLDLTGENGSEMPSLVGDDIDSDLAGEESISQLELFRLLSWIGIPTVCTGLPRVAIFMQELCFPRHPLLHLQGLPHFEALIRLTFGTFFQSCTPICSVVHVPYSSNSLPGKELASKQ